MKELAARFLGRVSANPDRIMHARDLFDTYSTTFSFEFFPPKTPEAAEQLFGAITELEPLKPTFVSITYGAGGSTRDLTHDLVVRLKQRGALNPVPHLTCVCHQEQELRSILERYARAGISNVLALGGDVPKEQQGYDRSRDAFQHAAGLVEFISHMNRSSVHPDPRGFGIGVAGYPEGHPGTPNRVKEMDYLKAKVDAQALSTILGNGAVDHRAAIDAFPGVEHDKEIREPLQHHRPLTLRTFHRSLLRWLRAQLLSR